MSDNYGRILVVDDESRAIELLTSILEGEGYEVQAADSGKLALISIAAQPPELILLDVKMPMMDGFEVCRRLKETEHGRRIPIVFVSALKEPHTWVEGLAIGAVDFVSKPFKREVLLARIRTHLELGRLRADLEARVAQRTAELHSAIEQLKLEVTERRRSELASRESEARFRRLANAAPVIIWKSNEDNCVHFRNEYAQEFTGRTEEEITGDHWAEVVHPDDLEGQQSAYSQNMRAGREFQLEYRIRRKDGEYRTMLDKGTPRFLPNGAFIGYVGIIIDLTDIKHSQEQAFAAQNLENLRVLAAGIAHDFNTLLGAVLGEADLALSDMPPDVPGSGNIEKIVALAKRAAGIVRLLMAYVGDPSAGSALEFVDVTSVVQELVPHLKTSISRHAEIRTHLAPRLPSIRAKALQIRQVVLNLILNALEALDGGKGIVTITTSIADLSSSCEAVRKGLPAGSYIRLEVSDTGHGMTETVQDRVFDPYYSTKFLGRGLGLAAVQGIIRSHGGVIAVRSAPGKGSTFEVLLPDASTVALHDSGGSPIG
jgi:PAS domain S-box-containing protein